MGRERDREWREDNNSTHFVFLADFKVRLLHFFIFKLSSHIDHNAIRWYCVFFCSLLFLFYLSTHRMHEVWWKAKEKYAKHQTSLCYSMRPSHFNSNFLQSTVLYFVCLFLYCDYCLCLFFIKACKHRELVIKWPKINPYQEASEDCTTSHRINA